MAVPVFTAPSGMSFPLSEQTSQTWGAVQSDKGYDTVATLAMRSNRTVTLAWPALGPAGRDYILSFLQALEGSNGPIQYTLPDSVPSPTGAVAALTEASGGSLSPRTITVWWTWYSASYGETQVGGSASIAASANFLVTATIPTFPAGVDGFRIYASNSVVTQQLQDTITNARTWTEAVGGLTSGGSPPSSNTLLPPVKWLITSVAPMTRIRPNRWAFSMSLKEQQV